MNVEGRNRNITYLIVPEHCGIHISHVGCQPRDTAQLRFGNVLCMHSEVKTASNRTTDLRPLRAAEALHPGALKLGGSPPSLETDPLPLVAGGCGRSGDDVLRAAWVVFVSAALALGVVVWFVWIVTR